MDPTETLYRIRQKVTLLDDPDFEVPYQDVEELVSDLSGLDDWLSKGGFLPEQWNTRKHGRPIRTEDGPTVLEGIAHGTRRGYNQGCKCIPCTAANRQRRNLTPIEMQEYNHD